MNKIILLSFLLSFLLSENIFSAREISLAGSITSSATGYEAAGVNPARFAFTNSSYNLFQLSNSFYNSLISFEIYNRLNGAVMYQENSAMTKAEFLEHIGNHDLNVFTNINLNIPFINFNNKRFAIHSRFSELITTKIGNDILLLSFDGNEWGKKITFDLEFKSMLIGEYGISYWTKEFPISIGATLKYLQGIGYIHFFPETTDEFLFTDSSGINFSSTYRMNQYPTGSGFAIDVGFATEDEQSGWHLGVAAINLFGFIKWDQNNLTQSFLGESISNFLPLDGYESKITYLNIINLSAENFLSGGDALPDSIISEESDVISLNQSSFKMEYPAIFRLGLTKNFGSNYAISYDLKTGFNNSENQSNSWINSVGIEISRFPLIPIRVGFSNGAGSDKRFGIGFGINLNLILLDFGLAWIGNRKLYNATGLELGLSLNLIR